MVSVRQTARTPAIVRIARVARDRRSSALYLLACTFLAAAVMRMNEVRHDIASLIASPAYAAVEPAAAVPPAEPMHPPKAEADAPPVSENKPPMHAAATADSDRCLDGAFLEAALQREKELETMALGIASRQRELEVQERRAAEQIAELSRQQQALAAAFGQAEAAAEEEAMQLVSIYEKMKPKQAAKIFDHMPPEVAAGFVRRMRQSSSAPIMANMDAQKAYSISLLLAGRSSAVRKQ